MDFTIIEQKVDAALKKLKQKDNQLLEVNVNERTISHKLAEYLQSEFLDLYVDCEYNRHEGLTKELDIPNDPINWDDIETKTIFPDIVVHQRKTDNENVLVIEIKKSSNPTPREFDITKLRALTKTPYNYKFGLFLEINVDGTNDCLKWYKNGEFFYKKS